MLEIIRQIPGPQFLLYFLFFIILLNIAGQLIKRSFDESRKASVPPALMFDSYTIAILKQKMKNKGLLQMVVLSLLSKKLISLEGKGTDTVIKTVSEETTENLHKLEKNVFQVIRYSKNKQITMKDLIADQKLSAQITDFYNNSISVLENHQLIYTSAQKSKVRGLKISAILLIILLGGTKLYLGLHYGKPVGFLIILLIIAVIVTAVVLSLKYYTSLGKRFITETEREYMWMKTNVTQNTNIQDGDSAFDPTWAVALFGLGMLATIPAYSSYTDAYNIRENQVSSGCTSSGCTSSSCSSSSCSGSSCSSSSCSGGGCGGCGGGGD